MGLSLSLITIVFSLEALRRSSVVIALLCRLMVDGMISFAGIGGALDSARRRSHL